MMPNRYNLKPRERLVLGDFRGCDLSSSPLSVNRHRATWMKNLIPEAGRNVKRPGWTAENHFGVRINGMWEYKHGNESCLIVHAGQNVKRIKDGFVTENLIELGKNRRSEALYMDGKLYLFGCGDIYAYGTWDGGKTYEMRLIANDPDTYTPTTTIGIPAESNTAGERQTFEPENRLQIYRKNVLIGETWTSVAETKVWRLDGNIQRPETLTVEIVRKKNTGQNGETNMVTTETPNSRDPIDDDPIEIIQLKAEKDKDVNTRYKLYNAEDSGKEEVGYFKKGFHKIALKLDTTPPIDGQGNITVRFTTVPEGTKEKPEPRDPIRDCTMGDLFGGGGNADRIFLAGNNVSGGNVEYYSESHNPTYFPDTNYNLVGSSETPIDGFLRIADGMLAVFKKSSMQEPVIYYQTSEDVPVIDNKGNLTRMDFRLVTRAGNVGEGLASRYASADFYGDPLILSKHGVYAVQMKNDIETADRYAFERSGNINRELTRQANLEEAVGIVFDGRYYLAVNDVCYIADIGHKFVPEQSKGEQYQYEWWRCENIPARVFTVRDGRLMFGTDDGMICSFNLDDEEYRFVDRTMESIQAAMTPNPNDPSLIGISEYLYGKIAVGDTLCLTSTKTGKVGEIETWSKPYALYLAEDTYLIAGGRIVLKDPDGIGDVHDGDVIYTDYPDIKTPSPTGKETVADKPYTVRDIDRGEGSFALYDGAKKVVLTEGGFRMCLKLDTTPLFVVNKIDETTENADENEKTVGFIQLSLYKSGDELTIIDYNKQKAMMQGYGIFRHHETVVAEWYTPVMDMGVNDYLKTLTALTVATEPQTDGQVTIGYETRNADTLARLPGLDLFTLHRIDFENFTFRTTATAYTQRLRTRNFNFIMLKILSDRPCDCQVYTITAEYKINKKNVGGN